MKSTAWSSDTHGAAYAREMPVIAIPLAYRDNLATETLSFALVADPGSLIDFEDVVSARAVVTRSDGERLDWVLAIADEPAATETTITLEREVVFADFFDVAGEAIAPATYEIRFLLTDDDGEHVLGRQWFAVELL